MTLILYRRDEVYDHLHRSAPDTLSIAQIPTLSLQSTQATPQSVQPLQDEVEEARDLKQP